MSRVPSRIVLTLCALLAASRVSAGEETIQLAEGAGRDLTVSNCVICHSADYIEMNAVVIDRAGWEATIRKMIARFGAPITPENATRILDYLSEHY